MRSLRGRHGYLFGALLLAVLLTGCGPEEPPAPPDQEQEQEETTPAEEPTTPDEVVAAATENTWGAPSKRVTVTVEIAAAGLTKTLDYVMVGALAQGTQTEVAPQGSDVMQVIKIGDDVYIKAGEPFWQWYVSLAQRQFVVGRWVKARYEDYPSTVPLASAVGSPSAGVTQVGTDVVHGTDVVVFADAEGSRYFVDVRAEPYLLRFEGSQATPDGAAAIVVEFSEIGEVTDVIAAPPGEIVDLYHLPTSGVGHD